VCSFPLVSVREVLSEPTILSGSLGGPGGAIPLGYSIKLHDSPGRGGDTLRRVTGRATLIGKCPHAIVEIAHGESRRRMRR